MHEEILKILNAIDDKIDYEEEKQLISGGQFDSMQLLQLVTEISEHFKIEVDYQFINTEHFNSIDSIADLVRGILENGKM